VCYANIVARAICELELPLAAVVVQVVHVILNAACDTQIRLRYHFRFVDG
jgi:hypothetical protein